MAAVEFHMTRAGSCDNVAHWVSSSLHIGLSSDCDGLLCDAGQFHLVGIRQQCQLHYHRNFETPIAHEVKPNRVYLTSAVNLETLAGDECGEVGGKEEDSASHIVWNAQATKRSALHNSASLFFGRPGTRPFGKSRGDDVDTHSPRA
jgi:hypothetical protein